MNMHIGLLNFVTAGSNNNAYSDNDYIFIVAILSEIRLAVD